MPPKPRRQDIAKLNTLLITHNEAISCMRLFSDEEQNDSLVNRSNITKNHHKYLQKIDKAEEIIKQARQMNVERAQLVKNGALKKNIVQRQPSEQIQNQQNEQNSIVRSKNIQANGQHAINKIKTRSQHSSFIDRKVEDQISRIEQIKHHTREETTQHILPREILEGQITKTILHVQYQIVKNYFKDKIKGINASTSPEQIYRIMNPFYELCGVKIALPLIKKYKNCAYFGNSNKETDAKYEGFLILHQEEKLYYGEFQNEKKNGKGTQIDFENDIVYIGTFSKGRKNGPFTVFKPNQKYIGELLKGQYNGFGELTTNFSIYKGYFEKGQRHGEGEEKFLQMGLTICGIFVNNKFTNNTEKIEQSRLNTIKSKSQTAQVHSKLITSIQKQINPQNTLQSYAEDKNIVFQSSPISKRNFQQFDCQFGAEEDADVNELQIIQTRKIPNFRIKQVKQPQKSFTQRKQTASQEKLSLYYSILKS